MNEISCENSSVELRAQENFISFFSFAPVFVINKTKWDLVKSADFSAKSRLSGTRGTLYLCGLPLASLRSSKAALHPYFHLKSFFVAVTMLVSRSSRKNNELTEM
jgi:hypothetical protein